MKDKIINAVMSIGAISVMLYITGCLVNADFNLKNWSEDSRMALGFVFMAIGLYSLIFVIIAVDNKK